MKSIMGLYQFMQDPISFLDKKFLESVDGLIKTKLLHKNFILVFDPELASEILTVRSGTFIQNKKIFDRITPVTGERGLVQLNGTESRDARKLVRPVFSFENMKPMKEIISKNSDQAFQGLRPGTHEISELIYDIVLKNAFEMFLGIESEEGLELARDFRLLNELCGSRMTTPFVLPSPRVRALREKLRGNIQQKLQSKRPSGINVHQIFKDDPSLIDQAMTFLFAGHETTASSLTFTLLLLGMYPKFQKDIALGNEDLAKRVYQEALRLFPPAYMLAREANQPSNLRDLKIERGDQILIGVKQIHKLSEFYKNPDDFNPERNFETKAFLPFGKGPKNCVGEHLAYTEAVSILSDFCRKFSFTSVRSQISFRPHITLHPGPRQFLEIEKRIYG